MAWKDATQELPQSKTKVLVVGYYLVMAPEEKPERTPNIYTEGYWDSEIKRWFVAESNLDKQLLHKYGRITYWIELPQ